MLMYKQYYNSFPEHRVEQFKKIGVTTFSRVMQKVRQGTDDVKSSVISESESRAHTISSLSFWPLSCCMNTINAPE